MRLVLALLALGLVVLGVLWFADRPAGSRGVRSSTAPALAAAPEEPRPDPPAPARRAAPEHEPGAPPPATSTPTPDDFPRSFVAGRVLDAGYKPVAGVSVEVRVQGQPGRPHPLAELRTDAKGAFEATVLGTGPFRLEAAESSGGGVRRGRVLEPVVAGTRDAVLVLPSSGRLRGRVLGPDEQPVTAFTLEFRPSRLTTGGEPGGAPARTTLESADGSFTSEELASGEWELTVVADGFAPSRGRECRVPSASEEVVVLDRAARLSGVVRTTDGRPRPGARVEASPAREPVFTDAEGAFTLVTNPGTLVLQATDPASGAGPPLQVDVAAGQERAGLVLSLGATGKLSGRVVTLANRPAAGREVRFLPLPEGREHEPVPPATTDALGQFVADLSPGQWEVSVALNERELEVLELAAEHEDRKEDSLEPFVSEEVLVAENEDAQVWLALAPAPVRVSGRLTKAGEPCDGGEVVAFDHRTGFVYRARVEGSSYVLGLGRSGLHLFHVTLGATTQAWFASVPADGTHELDFDVPVGWISGRVLTLGSGAVADVRVWAYAPPSQVSRGGSGHALTDAEGSFTLELSPGTYMVGTGESPEAGSTWGNREGILVVAGEHWTGLQLYLSSSTGGLAPALEVELRGPRGELVPDAVVTLTHQGDSRWFGRDDRPEPLRQPAPEGLTGFRSPWPPGPYAVVAEAPGYAQVEPVTAVIERSKPKRVVLVLQRACEVVVTVKSDGASGPVHDLDAVDTRGLVTGAVAYAAPESEPGLQAFRFPLLAAGPHRLRIRAGGELLERPLEVSVGGAPPLRLEVSIP
jgi:hypothetical protein